MAITSGKGLYSLRDAARLTGEPTRRLRFWFMGVERQFRGSPPVLQREFEHENVMVISFHDLLEARVAARLIHEFKNKPAAVRDLYSSLSRRGYQRPFCNARVKANKYRVLLQEVGRLGQSKLMDPRQAQPQLWLRFMEEIMDDVVWDTQAELASRWKIAEGIIVDPRHAFGQPVTAESYVPTYILAKCYEENDTDASLVASWYDTTEQEVLNAVAFEQRELTRKAA